MSADPSQMLERAGEYEAGGVGATVAAEEVSPTAAFQLGWRVAELYAQVNDPGEPSNDTLLPAHQSLEPKDQLELQLRAAAGDARRAGIPARAHMLEQLVPYARRAPHSSEAAEAFRTEVRNCHVELSKELWARDEAAGRAYELGNGMSDTYNRICRSYLVADEEPRTAWARMFASDRVERLKKLLDDLQSRLNPAGVAVVRHHLDIWRDNVPERIRAGGPPPLEKVREGLRRQTVIWRQLLAGDKEPEAYLDSDARAELRGDLRELVWSRCRRWIVPAAGILFLLVFFLPHVVDWYERSVLETGVASAAVAVAGALGLTKASMLITVRTRAKQWSELLWNRAVAKKVSDMTLVLDTVLPAPAPEPRSLAAMAASIGDQVKDRIRSQPAPMPTAHRPDPSF
ncbi:MAG: hypothetical protein ACRDLO_01060 [Solirubrobacterales bacterium]